LPWIDETIIDPAVGRVTRSTRGHDPYEKRHQRGDDDREAERRRL
jgi:hypothetical protein